MSNIASVVRIENEGPNGQGLSEWPAMNPADLISGEPVQHGYLCDEVEVIDYSVGVWDCTAFVDQPVPYPVDEFMLLLEGSVEMLMPGGELITVNAGEAFIIPKGLDCQWKMPQTVRKIFMIIDGGDPGDADNIGLNRVTVPDLRTKMEPPQGALSTRDTQFVNHDGRMHVYIDSYFGKQRGAAPQNGRQLINVLEGGVSFKDDPSLHFKAGDSLYLRPDNNLSWDIQDGTRLLVSRCDLPVSA